MQFGCQLTTFGDISATIDAAMMVEKSGFHLVTLPDHLFHPPTGPRPPWDVYVVLSAIATKTFRIKFAPGVSDILRRHPATIAHVIASLDHLSQGRAILALGAGEAFNLDAIPDVKWDKPVAMLEEAVKTIRLLWKSTREKPANFRGDFFKLKNAFLGLKPVQKPCPPIFIGGYRRRMRRLVGEQGDGWIPWIETPETYRKNLDEIREYAIAKGRNPKKIIPAVILLTDIFQDESDRDPAFISQAKICLASRTELLRELGREDLADRVTDVWKCTFSSEEMDRLYRVAGEIPDELVNISTINGKPEEALERLEEFKKSGVQLVILEPSIKRLQENLSIFKKHIKPYFEEQCHD